MQAQDVSYHWPDLSSVQHQYVVRDDQGRYGIAHTSKQDSIWARPIGIPANIEMAGSILMSPTCWHLQPDGSYTGTWYDYDGPTFPATIPDEMIRRLEIVDDLGILMPKKWADVALAGSDEMGHWNYGATLGKIGGDPPVKGQTFNEMTVAQAEEYAREVGESVTKRAIRLAAANGYIPDARKIGRDWLIPYDGFNHYLDHRPKRGPKPKTK